jgi:hypothetical protein
MERLDHFTEAERDALDRGYYRDDQGNWVNPNRKGRSPWFWAVVATSPIWLIPAAVIGFVLMVLWLIAFVLILGMSTVFAVLGKDEWIDELNRLPWVGNFLE